MNGYSSEIIWGSFQEVLNADSYFLHADDQYLYQIDHSTYYYKIHRIDRKSLVVYDSKKLDIKIDFVNPTRLKGFMLGDNLCFYRLDYDNINGVTTMFFHTINKTLEASEPLQVAQFNTPNIEKKFVLPDDVATRFFSNNLVRLAQSPVGDKCAIISCRDMVGNIAQDNKDKKDSPQRIFDISVFNGSFDNVKTIEFIPPSPDFYIDYFNIGLDGMIYICGRISEVDYNFGEVNKGFTVWNYNNLNIFKIDPETGEITSNELEEESLFINEYSIETDNEVHITGYLTDLKTNTSYLFYKKLNSELILTVDTKEELSNEFVQSLNLESESHYYVQDYENQYDHEPPKIPLLNYNIIFNGMYNSGELVTVYEKQSYVGGRSYQAMRGDLLIVGVKDNRIEWKRVIEKDQVGINNVMGTLVYHDGNRLHLFYNAFDWKAEYFNNVAKMAQRNITMPKHLIQLDIDGKGNIEKQDSLRYMYGKKQQFLVANMCHEVLPGTILLCTESPKHPNPYKASGKQHRRYGIIEY